MPRDPIVDEVRRVREEEAAKYGFDAKAILVASKSGNAVEIPILEHWLLIHDPGTEAAAAALHTDCFSAGW